MSAIVCGKRSLFDELPASSPVVLKRARFNSSPIRFSPPLLSSLGRLVDIFPDMDKQFLERALAECGDDLDSAIKSLHELRLGTAEKNLSVHTNNKSDVSVESNGELHPQGELANNGEAAEPTKDPSVARSLHMDGGEWVELFVREMMSASNIDDARARVFRALEVLEKSIVEHANAEAAQSFHQENIMLKAQLEALIQENTILKRAVSIQHERQKEYEDKTQELQHLKQLASQYEEQLRTLEVNNYALTMHLKQAQQGNSIPSRFNPDVF